MPKLEISHCRKNLIYEKPNFFVISPVVFAPGTQTYVTELTKIAYSGTYYKVSGPVVMHGRKHKHPGQINN
jgi:hypothetical protein